MWDRYWLLVRWSLWKVPWKFHKARNFLEFREVFIPIDKDMVLQIKVYATWAPILHHPIIFSLRESIAIWDHFVGQVINEFQTGQSVSELACVIKQYIEKSIFFLFLVMCRNLILVKPSDISQVSYIKWKKWRYSWASKSTTWQGFQANVSSLFWAPHPMQFCSCLW